MATTTPAPVASSESFAGEQFKPRDYLDEYYARVGFENDNLLQFFAEAYRDFPDDSLSVIEVGGGPTLYQLISAARPAKSIVFSDYLQSNLDEVKAYLKGGEGHFAWASFAEAALAHEGIRPTIDKVQERIRQLQGKIKKFVVCDILQVDPIVEDDDQYDVVSAQFVAESITSNRNQWKRAIVNELTLLKPGGWYISTGLLGANSWVAGEDEFVAFSLDEETVRTVLGELGLRIDIFKTIPAEHKLEDTGTPHQGYDGMFFVKAQKTAEG